MTLQSIPSPDLSAISVGLPTLQLLEAVDFSDDGRLLLVKAIYTDAADGGATQHLGFWLFDRASGAYVQSLTAQWQASDAFALGMALVGASIVGDSGDYQVLGKASTSGLESTDRLVGFDAYGVSTPDVLADLLGPDVAPRIERFAVSADGRFMALQTDDPHVWPVGEIDTNEVSDILLIDRLTSQITRVSKVGGAEVTGYVQLGSIAVSQGRVEVAFVTPSAFVSSDGNANTLIEAERLDAYLWSSAFDATGLTGAASFTLLSRRLGSTAAAGSVSREHPMLVTQAGVYFTGLAPDMVDGDANDAPDVFLASRTGAVERIGLNGTFEMATGATLLDADSIGQRIALLTDASPASSVEGLYQAVIVDRFSGQWQLASQTVTGVEADDIVINGVLSPVSNALAFSSAAPNLTGFDPVAQQGSLFLASFNQAPILVNAIADQSASEDAAFSFVVPANAFADVDAGDTLTYSASLANGSALPAWLSFNATTRTFSGTPTNADVGTLSVKVTASDVGGLSAGFIFLITTEESPGVDVIVTPYYWKSHQLLEEVSIDLGPGINQSTNSNGSTTFSNITGAKLDVAASRSVPPDESGATADAVSLQDAIAILKMVTGLPVNGAGRGLSPYQSLAADFDGNGSVALTDAIGVLKHVVGLPAPAPRWLFADEADLTMPQRSGLTPEKHLSEGGPGPVRLDDLTPHEGRIGLVGVLRGDVDGSWRALAGAPTVASDPATYFTELTIRLNSAAGEYRFDPSQWGVYGA